MQDALASVSLEVPKGGKAAAGDSLGGPDQPLRRCPIRGRAAAMLEVTMLCSAFALIFAVPPLKTDCLTSAEWLTVSHLSADGKGGELKSRKVSLGASWVAKVSLRKRE